MLTAALRPLTLRSSLSPPMTYIALLVWERIHWVLFPVHGLMHGQSFPFWVFYKSKKNLRAARGRQGSRAWGYEC